MREIIIEVPDEFGKTLKPEKVNTKIKAELVRCEKCKHRGKSTCSAEVGMAYPPPDDWFCADGKRRDEDG